MHLSGTVQPERWMIWRAEKCPALTHSSNSLPRTRRDRKPPTNASPAPFVSTILSLSSLGTACDVTTPWYLRPNAVSDDPRRRRGVAAIRQRTIRVGVAAFRQRTIRVAAAAVAAILLKTSLGRRGRYATSVASEPCVKTTARAKRPDALAPAAALSATVATSVPQPLASPSAAASVSLPKRMSTCGSVASSCSPKNCAMNLRGAGQVRLESRRKRISPTRREEFCYEVNASRTHREEFDNHAATNGAEMLRQKRLPNSAQWFPRSAVQSGPPDVRKNPAL